MLTADFDYDLPPELIAQTPPARRSMSRLLVLERRTGRIDSRRFTDLKDYLCPGDCLVVNETKVRPARLLGRKTTGAAVEMLLLSERSQDVWEALCRPAKRLPVGAKVIFDERLSAEVIDELEAGRRTVKFFAAGRVSDEIMRVGRIALPPYIHEPLDNSDRYQTVFARKPGSVAAPTAGLHFTRVLLAKIKASGVRVASVSLDIGLDTFRPIQSIRLEDHRMHSEDYELTEEAAAVINETKSAGGRIVAVGTTTVRTLESAGAAGSVEAGRRSTNLFIRPGFEFKMVDMMLTNFHLPKSTLLVLVSAFAGSENIRLAYSKAIEDRYRFYSFGDAMLVV